MTLIVAVNGPESLWLLADRRLSVRGRPLRDDARKIMLLETPDGLAIIGYAGLGATARGTEPADWMSAVLRNQKGSLEESLATLAEAMKRQVPRHMTGIPGDDGPAHHMIVPAFLGHEPRLYTIDLALAPDRKSYRFRYTRHVAGTSPPASPRTPRFCISGTGALYLLRDRSWMRSLLRLVTANDRGRVSPHVVSDHLASLNHEVHLGVTDNSVGPRCIVAWRYKKVGFHKGGGGHQFYTGTTRENSSPLPHIGNGMDVRALAEIMMPLFAKQFEGMRTGKSQDFDAAALNEELARLPDNPDENLR